MDATIVTLWGMFLKRLGLDPLANGLLCATTGACPDVWELDNGDFAIIGMDISALAAAQLPPTAGCAPNERIIRLPRHVLVNAKRDIPDRA